MDTQLKYTDTHEWVAELGDGIVAVGISEHAQEMLGDVVYVELPEIDSEFDAGDNFALVESVKAASDVYAPVSGTIVEINEELSDSPELINDSPQQDGWLVKIKLSAVEELENLKSEEDYQNSLDD